MNKKDIELKLNEFRLLYTGKDPFGPWSDLKRLYESLDNENKEILLSLLREKRNDDFWKDFIDLFFKEMNFK